MLPAHDADRVHVHLDDEPEMGRPRSIQVSCDAEAVADAWTDNHVVDHPASPLVAGEGDILRCQNLCLQVSEDVRLFLKLIGLAVPISHNGELDLERADVADDFLQLAQVVQAQASSVGLEVDGDEGDIPASEPDGGGSPLVASPLEINGPRSCSQASPGQNPGAT